MRHVIVLMCGALIAGVIVGRWSRSDPFEPAADATLWFGELRWRPEKPLPGGQWVYRTENMPMLRLVEARQLASGWSSYETFRRLPVLRRTMEVVRPVDGEWVGHGLDVIYYEGGRIGYALHEAGLPVSDQAVVIPPRTSAWSEDR